MFFRFNMWYIFCHSLYLWFYVCNGELFNFSSKYLINIFLIRLYIVWTSGVDIIYFLTDHNSIHKAEVCLIDYCHLLTARRSYQSILKGINPEYSLEGLMLKLQYFGHLMWRADSLEKTLILGKIEGRRRRGLHRMSWLDDIPSSMDMSLSRLQESVMDTEAWHAVVHRVAESDMNKRPNNSNSGLSFVKQVPPSILPSTTSKHTPIRIVYP